MVYSLLEATTGENHRHPHLRGCRLLTNSAGEIANGSFRVCANSPKAIASSDGLSVHDFVHFVNSHNPNPS